MITYDLYEYPIPNSSCNTETGRLCVTTNLVDVRATAACSLHTCRLLSNINQLSIICAACSLHTCRLLSNVNQMMYIHVYNM